MFLTSFGPPNIDDFASEQRKGFFNQRVCSCALEQALSLQTLPLRSQLGDAGTGLPRIVEFDHPELNRATRQLGAGRGYDLERLFLPNPGQGHRGGCRISNREAAPIQRDQPSLCEKGADTGILPFDAFHDLLP